MNLIRRQFLIGTAAAAVWPIAGLAQATAWPDRPIKFIIPYPPGGSSDILGRAIAERLRELVNAPAVVPENKPGGTSSLGIETAARAAPDGYTLLLAPAPGFTVLTHLRNLPYDLAAFEIIAGVAEYAPLLAVHNDLPVKTLPELVALAKKQPGKLTVGSAGVASAGHIFAEVLKRQAGIDVLHVPFKGSQDAANAMVGGQVDFIIDGIALGLVKGGRARALASFANNRHPQLPDVPNLKEAGLNVDLPPAGWGIMAPKGTPEPIVGRVSVALAKMLGEPETRGRLERAGLIPAYMSGDRYKHELEKGTVFFGGLVKATGMKAE